MADEQINETVPNEEAQQSETPATEVGSTPAKKMSAEEIKNSIIVRNGGEVKKAPTESPEPAKAEGQTVTPPENTPAKVETPAGVITEADVKDFPQLKTLIGKPYSEFTKAYANLMRLASTKETELQNLKKQQPKPAVETTTQQDKSLEQKIDELIDKYPLPDPLDDQRSYNKAWAKLQTQIMDLKLADANKPILSKFDEQEKIAESQRQLEQTNSLLREYLKGETVDSQQLMDGFTQSVQDRLEQNPSYYFGKPELLASDIHRYYLSTKTQSVDDRVKALQDEITALKAAKQPTTADIKRKIEGAPNDAAKPNVIKKTEKELSDADKIKRKIIERHEGGFLAPKTATA